MLSRMHRALRNPSPRPVTSSDQVRLLYTNPQLVNPLFTQRRSLPGTQPARQGLNRANADGGKVNAFSISRKQDEISEGGGGGDGAKQPNVSHSGYFFFFCVNSLSAFD